MVKLGLGGGILILAAVAAVFGVIQFINGERGREIRSWQVRLGIVADSRYAAIDDWFSQQFKVLSGLAENQSLQIYMTLLTQSGGEYSEITEDPAEIGYLHNLLTVTAERTGFKGEAMGADVDANVQKIGVAGIALLNIDNQVVVATDAMPPINGGLLEFLKKAPPGERLIYDLYINASGRPAMGFVFPVYAIQGDAGGSAQIGAVFGVKEVSDELYPLLIQPGAVEETAETLLVRPDNTLVEYLSPQADGTPPLDRKLALDTPELASSFVIEKPGGFASKRDYIDREVLVTGRAFKIPPWTLVHKIDRAEALAATEERLNRLMIMFLMFIGVVVAAILAVWWKGSSVRATESAEKFEKLAERFQNQRNFMHLVTDSQPNSITIFDEKGRYRWFNQVALDATGLPRGDLFEKSASSVVGPSEGKKIERWVDEALEKNERMSITHTLELDGRECIYQSDFIPLAERDGMPPGVLMVSQDITQAMRERASRERNMAQLVKTLVEVVDGRDPFSVHHSERVGIVAKALAEEIGLEENEIKAAEFAGDLMNLGKILVPESVLSKTDRLTEAEFKQIRESIQTSANLIEKIEFDGPVVETLRQLQEHVDGSGEPKGLKGDEILKTAKVVAVANAFVAMVSPRSFRSAATFDEVTDKMLKQSGKIFDRGVVAALISYLDNRGGRLTWAEFTRPSTNPAIAAAPSVVSSAAPPKPEPESEPAPALAPALELVEAETDGGGEDEAPDDPSPDDPSPVGGMTGLFGR